jgi:hypothetical protein
MSKFDRRIVKNMPAAVSVTACEKGQTVEQYSWDATQGPKQDPFFAVPSMVMHAPTVSLTTDDTRVSITF